MFPYSYPSPVIQRREQREPFRPIVGISSWDGQSRSAWTKAVPGIHTTFWFKLIVLEKARRVVYPKPCQIVGVNATSNHVSFILAPFILSTLSHNNVTAFPFEPSIRLRSFITYPGNCKMQEGSKGGQDKLEPKTRKNRDVRQRHKMEKTWLPGVFPQGPGGLWSVS